MFRGNHFFSQPKLSNYDQHPNFQQFVQNQPVSQPIPQRDYRPVRFNDSDDEILSQSPFLNPKENENVINSQVTDFLTQTQTIIGTQSQKFDLVQNGISGAINNLINSFQTDEERLLLFNKLDGKKIGVLTAIRNAILGLIPQLVSKKDVKMLSLTCAVRTKTRRKKCGKTQMKTLRCFTSKMKSFAVKMRILEMIFNLVYTHSYATKRDLYYKHKNLFGTQLAVDTAVTAICGFLGYDRHDLNIISCSKGELIGPMFIDTGNGLVDCSATPVSISSAFMEANIFLNAKFILVVEKDTIFQRLIDSCFCLQFPDALLVTGRGFPDIATRQFLKHLQNQFQIPIFALVDCDPHGLHIFLTYKYGSTQAAKQIEGGGEAAVINTMQLIGLKPTHLTEYNHRLQEIPFRKTDEKTIELVKRRALEVGDKALYSEACLMAENEVKVELEALVSHSPHFLIQYLRDCEKKMPWVLLSDDIFKSTPLPRKLTQVVVVPDEDKENYDYPEVKQECPTICDF